MHQTCHPCVVGVYMHFPVVDSSQVSSNPLGLVSDDVKSQTWRRIRRRHGSVPRNQQREVWSSFMHYLLGTRKPVLIRGINCLLLISCWKAMFLFKPISILSMPTSGIWASMAGVVLVPPLERAGCPTTSFVMASPQVGCPSENVGDRVRSSGLLGTARSDFKYNCRSR